MVASVSPLELGPPVGWPVQYRVSGPDPSVVRDDRARARAGRGREGRTRERINFDWIEPAREVRIRSTRTRRACSA